MPNIGIGHLIWEILGGIPHLWWDSLKRGSHMHRNERIGIQYISEAQNPTISHGER